MKNPRWLADQLRTALEQQTPDILPGLLRATYLPPDPPLTKKSRRRRGYIPASCALLTAVIFFSLSLSGRTRVSGHTFRLPTYCAAAGESAADTDGGAEETCIPLLESGVVPEAFGQGTCEQQDEPTIPEDKENAALILMSEDVWTGEIGVRTAAGGALEYRTHLRISLAYAGEDVESVTYTANHGRFEQRVLLETREDYARYAGSMDHINRTGGVTWGYLPLDGAFIQTDGGADSFVLQITLLADGEASALDAQQAFRSLIASTRIQADILFADGSRTRRILRADVSGAVEGEVTLIAEPPIS